MTEEQVLEWMEVESFEGAAAVEALTDHAAAGAVAEASEWAGLLFEARAAREDSAGAMELLKWRVFRAVPAPEPQQVHVAVERLFARRHAERKRLEAAGFGSDTDPKTCFRRLDTLNRLEEGALVWHGTWGFGKVSDVDDFYGQVEVDFEMKTGEHEMSMAYAVESMEVLAEDHLLALRYNDPERLIALINRDPAEVVRCALRSWGDMPVGELTEKLCPSIVAEEQWKSFWESARRGLKSDPLVEIPARRSEPVRLLKKAKAYDLQWFETFRAERDMTAVLDRLDALLDEAYERSTATLDIVADRLAFVVTGSGPAQAPELKARAALLAKAFHLGREQLEYGLLLEELYADKEELRKTLENLPARHLRPFLELLAAERSDCRERFIELLPEVNFPVLNELLALEMGTENEACYAQVFRQRVGMDKASVQMLLWLQRNPEKREQWRVVSLSDLAFLVLNELEKPHAGHNLRAQNQLKERFQDKAWLESALAEMREKQREDFLRRLNASGAWSLVDRNSVVAKVVKAYPGLHFVILKDSAAPVEEALLTSRRSYREKQTLLDRLVKVEIPRNAKEIELARSYGDLRENAEYKMAKERQSQLMRQTADLKQMLKNVKPTDFSGFAAECAGPATEVELRTLEGGTECYVLLGFWDSDEALHIISSETAMARALSGSRPGDQVKVPSLEGERVCTVTAVLPLGDAVRAWLAAGQEE